MTRMKTVALTVAACLAFGTAGCSRTKEPIRSPKAPDVKTEPIIEIKTTTHNKLEATKAALPPYASKTISPEEQNKLNEQLFHAIIDEKDAAKVKALIAQGADVNNCGKASTDTPLSWAAHYDLAEIVQILIDNGAHVNATRSFDNQTALMEAAMLNNVAVVVTLIKNGATLEIKDNDFGWTALTFALDNSAWGAARELINRGADVNTVGEFGETPLMYAAGSQDSSGDLELAKLLIAKKANVNQKDNAGYSALMRAALAQDDEMIKLLINAGADIKGDLEFARKKSTGETAETSMERLYFSDVVRSLEEHIKSSPVEGNCSDDWNNVGGSHRIREGTGWVVID